jgi:phage gpG-like protein
MDETKRALERVRLEIAAAAPTASKAGGAVLARNMQPPRDTGTLAARIAVVSDGETAHVGSTVPYDRFVQFGTRNMAAQPYGQQAASDTSGIVSAIAAVLKTAIR